MKIYQTLAKTIKTMIAEGALKHGKSVALKQVALAADLSPGRCAEECKGCLGVFLDKALQDAGIADVSFEQIGSGRYRRFVFRRSA